MSTQANIPATGTATMTRTSLPPATSGPGTCQGADAPLTRGQRLMGRLGEETGASTAEYAITVLAACGFAAVLVVLLKSGEVKELLMGIITSALSLGS
jgi:hypothetical protein